MDYWIDGYNLLFKIKSHMHSLHQSREELLNELKLHLIKSQMKATIIFDSAEENSGDFPSKKSLHPIEVIFSPAGMTADDYILEMLRTTISAKNTVIVTNDSHLAFSCRNSLARSYSIDDFLKLVFKEERKRHMSNYDFLEDPDHQFKESEENIQMFVKIFEDRLNRNQTGE
ncbi:MAG: NYN domain-containing protein [Rhabdochlamydiaceae bacterium]|nr:NYN domain-containing protein [Candidatus Amphrikana amoebophyrae]